jgi:hypothetical protein
MSAVPSTVRAAYRAGRAAVDNRDDNPFIEERDPELYQAWEDGYEFEVDAQADSYCCSLDPSMRDTHGSDL